MKKINWIATLLLFALPATGFAAENSASAYISNITARDQGQHAVFLHGFQYQNFDECILKDRAILINTDGENKALLATLLTAMTNGFKVELRVTTCVPVQVGSNNTAPKLVKVKVFVPVPDSASSP